MAGKVNRQTVDLEAYPDLLMIVLGMRVRSPRGLKTLMRTGRRIEAGLAARPDGLLLHENVIFGLFPPHLGMREYWRDFDALERWARSDPHRAWWKELLSDPGGTSFWHETYFKRGGIETIYLDMDDHPIGLGKVASAKAARKSMFSARTRLGAEGSADVAPAIAEDAYYRQ